MKREVAIIGAGYVGLPLAQVFGAAGIGTVLVDFSAERVEAINRGESYIEDVPSEVLVRLVEAGGDRGEHRLRRGAGVRRDHHRAADATHTEP